MTYFPWETRRNKPRWSKSKRPAFRRGNFDYDTGVRFRSLIACAMLTVSGSAWSRALPEPAFRDEILPLSVRAEDQPLVARVRVPREPHAGRLPAVLVFGGFEEASKVLDLFEPSTPAIVASFDYPFAPPRKLEFPGSLKLLPVARRTVHGTLEGIQALVTALLARPDVDPARVTIVGASLGAPFALIAAGNDARVAGLVLIHGFGDVARTAQSRLEWTLGRRYPALLARPLSWVIAQGAWAYGGLGSPEKAARRLRPSQRVLMLQAAADSFIPVEVSDSLWVALSASSATSRQRLVLPGDHLQPGSGALLREIQGEVDRWMAGANLL